MLKAEGCDPILVECDLSEGEGICKKIVDEASASEAFESPVNVVPSALHENR